MKKLILLICLLVHRFDFAADLFPGEEIINCSGVPALVKFKKGKEGKPLVVFIPGDAHLARISYGYPEGNEKDFLEYWLNEQGYSFLAVSYPLENSVYEKVYPQFSISDWGAQIACVVQAITLREGLSSDFIALGWSMGGSVIERLSTSAKEEGLNLLFFVSLSAVPPLPFIMQTGAFSPTTQLSNGLADRAPLLDWCWNALEQQSKYNEHPIISKGIYKKYFFANIPVNLIASNFRYRKGGFIDNNQETLDDGGVFNFKELPWIACLRDNSPTDAKIALIDPTCWNFLRAEMVYQNYLSGNHIEQMCAERWNKVMKFVDRLPRTLTLTVSGNHFFFVGEKGAKETASKIPYFENKIKDLKKKLQDLTTPTE